MASLRATPCWLHAISRLSSYVFIQLIDNSEIFLLVARNPEPNSRMSGYEAWSRKSVSQLTRRWKKGDSNCRSRLERAIPGLASSVSWRAAVPARRGGPVPWTERDFEYA